MANPGVHARRREAMLLLGGIERVPGVGEHQESAEDQDIAENVERPEVRVAPPSEHHFQQMTAVMRPEVDAGKMLLQPSRKEVDRQGEAIHLREQRDDESRERPKRPPVAARRSPGETRREKNED